MHYMSESSFLNQHLLISLVLMKSLAYSVYTFVYHILYTFFKDERILKSTVCKCWDINLLFVPFRSFQQENHLRNFFFLVFLKSQVSVHVVMMLNVYSVEMV